MVLDVVEVLRANAPIAVVGADGIRGQSPTAVAEVKIGANGLSVKNRLMRLTSSMRLAGHGR